MCGIIGLISRQPVAERLIEGLQRLEYRGYDSTGIATIVDGIFHRRRAEGKLIQLKQLVSDQPIVGNIGIGHTRWATHGIPSEVNAHPHMSKRVALVHNGIIENYQEIKDLLQLKGFRFNSQTDTEVLTYLITDYLEQGCSPLHAVQKSLQQIHGTFALAILFADHPDTVIVARQGSPLVIGYGESEISIGSDALTLVPWTQKICYLDDGDHAVITPQGVEIYDHQGVRCDRPIKHINLSSESLTKGSYRHYMLKEIYEQPAVLAETIKYYLDTTGNLLPLEMPFNWKKIEKLTLVACGTSYYAAAVAKYWFERYARLSIEVDIASEFRYRSPVFHPKGAAVFLSQSGETIDTLAALQLAREASQSTLAIVNVHESSMERLAQKTLYTYAGPEIGVASTKNFTAQLFVLGCLALKALQDRYPENQEDIATLTQGLLGLPDLMKQVLDHDEKIQNLAIELAEAKDILYLGRGSMYPVALEGALKLKELSYIHAEGYPAGELKHGPIALIEQIVPSIVLCPSNEWFAKTKSNLQEVLAREGKVICLTDAAGAMDLNKFIQAHDSIIQLPFTKNPIISAILYSIPVQLMAYYVALMKGTDVDQPRNLAKSVTVE